MGYRSCELDLYEISLVPAPANPDTRILSTKSAGVADRHPVSSRQEVELREHRMLSNFLSTASPSSRARPATLEAAVEREENRQARELRRQCDRLRLEAALGWPTDEERKAMLATKPEPEISVPSDAELRAQAAELGIRVPPTRHDQMRIRARNEWAALLGGDTEAKRKDRELRLEWDRLRHELSLDP
jgi:hypothetical protein